MSDLFDAEMLKDIPDCSKLVVFGYIRSHQKEVSATIPASIQSLCSAYYYDKILVSIADGCANSYTMQYPQQPHFFYRGVRPIESSSGSYSGGPDVKYNVYSQIEALEWRDLINNVLNDDKNQSKSRPKGMWIIRNKMDNKSCFIRKGEKFHKLRDVLNEIKSKGEKLETNDDDPMSHWF